MNTWTQACHQLSTCNKPFVLVTLLAVRGSTPRDTDSKMVVGKYGTFDSIGGGNLEHQITLEARELLQSNIAKKTIKEFSLGASLGQCCGGHASVLMEVFPATPFNVVMFGAGHVGTALATILNDLPCKLIWIDTRKEFVSSHSCVQNLVYSDSPLETIRIARPHSSYVILTHDHTLDYSLCEAVVKRQQKQSDVRYFGVIGSKSKSAKFRKKLAFKGFDENLIQQLYCPMGLPTVSGKRPMEVAVSIASQLIELHAESDTLTSGNVARGQLLKLIQYV